MADRNKQLEEAIADLSNIFESYPPDVVVGGLAIAAHEAELFARASDLPEFRSEFEQAANLFTGTKNRFPALEFGQTGDDAEQRVAEHFSSAGLAEQKGYGLEIACEALSELCFDWALDLPASAPQREREDWNRAGKLYQWLVDRLADIGFSS